MPVRTTYEEARARYDRDRLNQALEVLREFAQVIERLSGDASAMLGVIEVIRFEQMTFENRMRGSQ